MDRQYLEKLRYLRMIATIASFNILFLIIGGFFLLSFNAARIEVLFSGEVVRFKQVIPSEYPFYMGFLWLAETPFILGSFFGLMRDRIFIPTAHDLLYHTMFLLNICMMFLGLIGLVAETYAQLYAIVPNDIRTFSILRMEAYYFFVVFAGIHHTILGWNLLQWKNVPSWLGWFTLGSGLLAFITNIFQPNYDLPSIRVILPIMIISFDVMIWAFYLWVVTLESPLSPPKTLPTMGDDSPTIPLGD